ncbi:hypothetical protein Moror_5970 [Moniliophthora roreri MCA 2997]|uniref:Uncharacterized protein n=1 Tax=Moniliophthora roreri (strain MCA 2997) TaxID=1381753 RepID=V2WES8_MONRO|nr:hypothetical protein Moror_5970 [Moniliophthora roreri MCA 2997]
MFNFFRKNSTADSTSQLISNEQLRTPSPSVVSAVGKTQINESPIQNDNLGPPDTPSPPAHPLDADLGLISNPAALYELISSVPAKTLHEYTLNHLIPPPADSKRAAQFKHPIHTPSSITLTHLTSFFSSLTPPPRLHCVRCHNFYFDVENNDRSCLVAHDDESAEVERVGIGKGKIDAATQYETLWGCCGKTVEGDGDMGPPDGWCYEGKHTTDTKRARFRADSSIHDDKLTSCTRLKCFEPKPETQDVSSSDEESDKRSRPRKRVTKKRARPANDDGEAEREAEVDAASATLVNDDAVSATSSKDKPKKKPAKPRKKRAKTTDDDKAFKPDGTPSADEVDDMEVDETASVSSKRKPRAKPRSKAAPTSRKKPAANPGSTSASEQGTPAGPSSPRMPPPSSPGSPTRSVKGERTRKQSVTFSKDADETASIKKSVRPRSSVGGGRKPKKVEEIVQSSIDGET